MIFMFNFIPFIGQDELNKLACSQCMGLYSSIGQSIAAITQRPWA